MPPIVIGHRRGARFRRLLKRAGVALLAVLVSVALSYTAFRRWTLMTPPSDEGPQLPQRVEVRAVDTVPRMVVGDSWMQRQDGIWRLQLTGDPRAIGHAHGLLAGRVTVEIDRHMNRMMKRHVTTPLRRWLVSNVVRWRFRSLPENIPASHLVELAAFSRTMKDLSDFGEAPFQRMVYYHALHDMTQRLEGSPIVGCTAFAAWGGRTVDGHLIVGRNFDFEGGEVFDREKAVILMRSPNKLPFVSVAWPGMMGVVTGVNAKRIYVSINAARTDHPLQAGIPMVFLVREILERAESIDDALAVIEEREVMVAENLLIADGKSGRALVVELSPGGMEVRKSKSSSIGVTNHFLTQRYKRDAANDWLKRYTTSDSRYKRLLQLLKRFGGRIDVPTAALILRNRTGVNDEPLGIGNRNAIDALITTHSVIVDLTEMVLWVSRGPHLLGPLVPVDLKPLFGIPVESVEQPEPIAADILLGSDELLRYRQAKAQLAHARELASSGALDAALDYAGRAVGLMPDSAEAHKLRADLLWRSGARKEAKRVYAEFLKLNPAYLRDKEEAKSRLAQ